MSWVGLLLLVGVVGGATSIGWCHGLVYSYWSVSWVVLCVLVGVIGRSTPIGWRQWVGLFVLVGVMGWFTCI